MLDIPDPEVRQWYINKQSSVAPPTILQLEVTKNCNLRCIMCHKGQVEEFCRDDITDLILEQVKPVYPYLKYAMLFGDGEPLVFSKFWDVVQDIRHASPNCAIDFINNGTMMNEQNILRCFEYNISAMGLSLGGATPETHNKIRLGSNLPEIIDSFLVLKNMKEQRNTFEPYVKALIVVMRSNYKELPSFIELCHNMGVYHVTLQTLFVTAPTMEEEQVSVEELTPYAKKCLELSKRLDIGLDAGIYGENYTKKYGFNPDDLIFQPRVNAIHDAGYCKFQQPWNTVYVLHDGKIVPDCHWWSSVKDSQLNHCGQIDQNTDIMDIWNGSKYKEIRSRISNGDILPQCRGCGLAGGVIESMRNEQTDHANPEQEITDTWGAWENRYSEHSHVKDVRNIPINQFQQLSENSFNIDTTFSRMNFLKHDYDRIKKFNAAFDYSKWLNNIVVISQERKEGKSLVSGLPLYVDIELRNICNLECVHCESVENRGAFLDDEDIEKVKKIIPYAEIIEISKIAEPFLNINETLSFLKTVRHLNPVATLRATTNGMTLSRPLVESLINLEFDALAVSIDGHDKKSYETFRLLGKFDKLIENLQTLKKVKREKNSIYPILHISCQVNANVRLPEIVEIAHKAGANSIWFGRLTVYDKCEEKHAISKISTDYYDNESQKIEEELIVARDLCSFYNIGMTSDVFPGIKQQYRTNSSLQFAPTICAGWNLKNVCPNGDPWFRFCLNPTGGVSPCCWHDSFDNIHSKSIEEIWNGEFMTRLRTTIANGKRGPGCSCHSPFEKAETLVKTLSLNVL